MKHFVVKFEILKMSRILAETLVCTFILSNCGFNPDTHLSSHPLNVMMIGCLHMYLVSLIMIPSYAVELMLIGLVI